MSKPYAEVVTRRSWPQAALAVSLALALAACGASAPRQAEVERPRDTVRGEANVAAAAAPTERRSRADRGGEVRAPVQELAAADVTPIPEAVVAAYARAIDAMRAENWLEAELGFEQLIAEHPDYAGPHVNLAIVYLHEGRRDDARAALDHALAIEPGHAAANTQLGILLREQGRFAEAEAAYRRALDTDPNHALAHYNLGVLLDIYLRRQAEALEHYEAYQSALAQPNEAVGRWIIDLRRRVGGGTARVAQEDAR